MQRTPVSRPLPPRRMLLPFFLPSFPQVGGFPGFLWGRGSSCLAPTTSSDPDTSSFSKIGGRLRSLCHRFGRPTLRSGRWRRTRKFPHRRFVSAWGGHGTRFQHASGGERKAFLDYFKHANVWEHVCSGREPVSVHAEDEYVVKDTTSHQKP